jgi:hypothetical protein
MSNLKAAAIGAAVAAVVATAAVALAGTGTGSVFNLGQTNTVNAQSTLTGNAGAAPQLKVENTGGGPAVSAVVKAGSAPLKVSSSTKVGNLNADLLDGVSSTGFLRSSGDSTFWYSPYDLVPFSPNLTFNRQQGPAVSVFSSAFGFPSVLWPLDQPQATSGTSLRVKAVQICFSTANDAQISFTGIYYGKLGDSHPLVEDGTDRASAVPTCYTEQPPSPVTVVGSLYLLITFYYPATTDFGTLYSVKLIAAGT